MPLNKFHKINNKQNSLVDIYEYENLFFNIDYIHKELIVVELTNIYFISLNSLIGSKINISKVNNNIKNNIILSVLFKKDNTNQKTKKYKDKFIKIIEIMNKFSNKNFNIEKDITRINLNISTSSNDPTLSKILYIIKNNK